MPSYAGERVIKGNTSALSVKGNERATPYIVRGLKSPEQQ